MPYVIKRFPHGITLNPPEYLLDEEDGKIREFDTAADAIEFLNLHEVEVSSVEEAEEEYGLFIDEITDGDL